jgi:pimeloyl-ACP methyl ester carboxylesterase
MKKLLAGFFAIFLGSAGYGQINYGNNPTAGGYYNTGDARIYYEVYGSGSPVVLLHGGIYGYIAEYRNLIPELSKNHTVIAIATRGHGRSELGYQSLSYRLFAEDAYRVIRHLTKDSVILIGFSDGGDTGYYLAADHPELVKKLVAIGGNLGFTDFSGEDKAFIDRLTGANMEKNEQGFVSARKALMPEPARFDEFVDDMANLWREKTYVSKEKITAIQCPSLIIAGQNDGCPVERYVAIYRLLQKGQLAIIPGSDHLVLRNKPALMQEIISSYIDEH